MKKIMVEFNEDVLKVMANGIIEERGICPVCGKPKELHHWTCSGCRKYSFKVKQKVMNLKLKLSATVFNRVRAMVKEVLKNPKFRYSSYRNFVNYLVKNMPEIKEERGMFPLAALEGAIRMVRHELFSRADVEEELRERSQQFLSELPNEARVEIDVNTPQGEFADPKKIFREGLFMEGVKVPWRIIKDACAQVNMERNEKRKNWHDGAWKSLVNKINKNHGYIDISKIVETGFVFKGRAVEDKMVRAACYEVINERKFLNKPRVATRDKKKFKKGKFKEVNKWTYNPQCAIAVG